MTAFEFDVRQLLACSWSCFREFCFTFTRTSQYLYLDSFETRTGWLSVSLREYGKCSSKLKFKSSNSNGFMIACIEKFSLWDVRQCPAITSDLIKLSDACLGEIQRLRCKSELLLALHNVHTMIMNETKLECREYVSFAAVEEKKIPNVLNENHDFSDFVASDSRFTFLSLHNEWNEIIPGGSWKRARAQ